LFLIQAQSTWQDGTLVVIFDSLLSFTNHTKPKIRKASQHAICAVLRGSYFMLGDNPPDCHPAAAR
jgi:ribosomal RNA-processing protein 12